jgi:hypothetical protein
VSRHSSVLGEPRHANGELLMAAPRGSKAARIRALCAAGIDHKAVAKDVGCRTSYVRLVLSRKAQPKRVMRDSEAVSEQIARSMGFW